jgi:hypothetical protein
MSNVITESGIDFIAENSFHIEKSPLYAGMADGVRSVEFIRAVGDKLLFVEAKTTFANPHSPAKDNFVKFQTEVGEICEKFVHSLNMYSSVMAGANNEAFPESYNPPDKVSLVFVLVIKNHAREWCKPVYSKLVETLPSSIKSIWKPQVVVINQDIVIKTQLALENKESVNG